MGLAEDAEKIREAERAAEARDAAKTRALQADRDTLTRLIDELVPEFFAECIRLRVRPSGHTKRLFRRDLPFWLVEVRYSTFEDSDGRVGPVSVDVRVIPPGTWLYWDRSYGQPLGDRFLPREGVNRQMVRSGFVQALAGPRA